MLNPDTEDTPVEEALDEETEPLSPSDFEAWASDEAYDAAEERESDWRANGDD